MIKITGELTQDTVTNGFGLILWLDTTDSVAAEKRAHALLEALKVISVQVGPVEKQLELVPNEKT